jgi:hypothetical protein
LAAYSECGCIAQAALAARIDRTTHYVWMSVDKTYPSRFSEAQQTAADMFESEAMRRAMEGTLAPVLHRGKPIYVNGQMLLQPRYSDGILMRLLEVIRPERYGRK